MTDVVMEMVERQVVGERGDRRGGGKGRETGVEERGDRRIGGKG